VEILSPENQNTFNYDLGTRSQHDNRDLLLSPSNHPSNPNPTSLFLHKMSTIGSQRNAHPPPFPFKTSVSYLNPQLARSISDELCTNVIEFHSHKSLLYWNITNNKQAKTKDAHKKVAIQQYSIEQDICYTALLYIRLQ